MRMLCTRMHPVLRNNMSASFKTVKVLGKDCLMLCGLHSCCHVLDLQQATNARPVMIA